MSEEKFVMCVSGWYKGKVARGKLLLFFLGRVVLCSSGSSSCCSSRSKFAE